MSVKVLKPTEKFKLGILSKDSVKTHTTNSESGKKELQTKWSIMH